MSKEAMKLALEALAVKFSEGWHEGIKIDASDIMLLNDAAQALAEQPAQQEPVDFASLLREAEELVREKPTWKRFIEGTPLSNDIAVWMTVFAQDVARRTSPPAQQEPVAWRYTDARGHYRYHGFVANFDKKYPMLKPQPLYTSPIAQQEPVAKVDANDEGYWADILTDASAQFNAAIDFAIEEGSGAAVFLRCWREGDTSEWPEFEAAHGIKENT